MLRPSSGGFVLGVAAEIAVVVAAVSVIPRLDLSGGRAASAAAPAAFVPAPHETVFYEQPTPAPARPPARDYAAQSPRLFASAPVAASPTYREPPPLITADPTQPGYAEQRPAYVEQRLDRASQGLVNGLGSYVSRAAGNFSPENLRQPAPALSPLPPTYSPPPAWQPPQTAAPQSASFATKPPAQAVQPRPWMRY